MPRSKRKYSTTMVYHIMARGNEKKVIFNDKEDRKTFLDIIGRGKEKYGFELYGFCLMDNHFHLLIKDRDNRLSEIMKTINTSYAVYYNRKYDRVGHLFQDRFKSETVLNDRQLIAVLRYIHNNPIKAGIVSGLDEYEWSSYKYYISPAKKNIPVDCDFILGIFEGERDRAIKAFETYSMTENEGSFLDVAEETTESENQEILEYIETFLKSKGTTLDDIVNMKGRIKGTVKHELINELKQKFELSARKIAHLLCISKSTVQRLD